MFERAVRRVAVASALIFVVGSGTARAEQSTLSPEVGYHYGEQEDARWAAAAGALRAFGQGITAIFGNPANLAMSRVYHIAGLVQIWPEARRQSYGAAAMDSVTSKLAAGLGYVWTDQDPDGLKRRSHDLRLALAYPFSDRVSFGMTGRYLRLSQNGLGPLGQSFVSGGLEDEAIVNGFSFDAGLRVNPTENIAIGALGSNLSNPGTGLQPTSFGGGAGFANEDVLLEVDILGDFTTWRRTTARVMAGGEYLAGDHFPLRLGYGYDDGAKSHAISGGVGYIDPQFSVEFSGRRIVSGEQATSLFITVQYFVESTGYTHMPDGSF